jgi:ABC-2 type transport system ATP-binding protein
MILDIYKPDSGRITVLGGQLDPERKNRIGYLPEERGLYQDLPLERVLLYLAALKGIPRQVALKRLDEFLEMFSLSDYRKKNVKEMSKGMQQKAQIIATLLHQPDLIVVDEPFSALDPVNTQMVKALLVDLHRQGVAIIMSTHQMAQVEELCERIVLIDHGQVVLYGGLMDLRRQYSGHAVLVRSQDALPDLPGVIASTRHNASQRLELAETVSPQEILSQLVAHNVRLEQFEIAAPTLEEIFVRVVKG